VRNWVNCKTIPDAVQLAKIAELTGKSVTWFYGDTGKAEHAPSPRVAEFERQNKHLLDMVIEYREEIYEFKQIVWEILENLRKGQPAKEIIADLEEICERKKVDSFEPPP
jgi:hypothetical protein